tara:strand:- start:30 stop:299 length:270 start_codon:yes stop_codon:yes gene_type:complete
MGRVEMPKTDKNGKRIYTEKDKAYSKKTAKQRACRNKCRQMAMKEGKVSKGDGKEVDHKTALSKGGSCDPSNLRIVSRKENRKKYNKKV